jgi:hypothetical protein
MDAKEERKLPVLSESDFLEAVGDAAAADAPSEHVAHIMKEAAVAIERWNLNRAFNDYNRIQRVKDSACKDGPKTAI